MQMDSTALLRGRAHLHVGGVDRQGDNGALGHREGVREGVASLRHLQTGERMGFECYTVLAALCFF